MQRTIFYTIRCVQWSNPAEPPPLVWGSSPCKNRQVAQQGTTTTATAAAAAAAAAATTTTTTKYRRYEITSNKYFFLNFQFKNTENFSNMPI